MRGLVWAVLLAGTLCAALSFRKHRRTPQDRRRDRLWGGPNSTMLYVVPLRLGSQWFLAQLDSGSAGTSVAAWGCNGGHCVTSSPGFLGRACVPCALAWRLAGRSVFLCFFADCSLIVPQVRQSVFFWLVVGC